MAISRRAILKLGVSYGTGAINHGNDSIAYERELRKLANNPAFSNFESAMEQAEEIMAAVASAEAESSIEAAESAEAESSAGAAVSAEVADSVDTAKIVAHTESFETAAAEAAESAELVEQTQEQITPSSEGESEAENPADKATEDTPHENPLKDIIVEAKHFRDVCSQLALSSLYLQMTDVINTMQEECLPAVDDLAKIKQDYNAILDYLKHC